MNAFGFEANYLDLVFAVVSAILAIVTKISRSKYKTLVQEYQALVEDHGRLRSNQSALTEEHTRLDVKLRNASDERDRFAADLKAASDERSRLVTLGKVVAEVLGSNPRAGAVARAIRAAAKGRGVLPEVEALLTSAPTDVEQ